MRSDAALWLLTHSVEKFNSAFVCPLTCTQSVNKLKQTMEPSLISQQLTRQCLFFFVNSQQHQKQFQNSWTRLKMKSPVLNNDVVYLLVQNLASLQPPELLSVLLLLCTWVPSHPLKKARILLSQKVNTREKPWGSRQRHGMILKPAFVKPGVVSASAASKHQEANSSGMSVAHGAAAAARAAWIANEGTTHEEALLKGAAQGDKW